MIIDIFVLAYIFYSVNGIQYTQMAIDYFKR